MLNIHKYTFQERYTLIQVNILCGVRYVLN